MWSGPRNISTALMRAWGSRPDTAVCDEPLYAFYLSRTGAPHPGRERIIASGDTDWRSVVTRLTGPIPGGRSIFYQKHMAHHLLPEVGRAWLGRLSHAFLIRDPRKMLTSLLRVLPEPRLEDTGLPQQRRLVAELSKAGGGPPPVLDARDVLEQPEAMLRALCAALDVPFLEAMLSWAPGPRDTDGPWADIWYGAVERSAGFEPYRPKPDAVPERLAGLLDACETIYRDLHALRLTPGPPATP